MNIYLHGVAAGDMMNDVYFRPDYTELHAENAEAETLSTTDFVHSAVVRAIPGTMHRDLETSWGYGGPVALDSDSLTNGVTAWRAKQKDKGRVAEFIRLHPFINPMGLMGLVDHLKFNRVTVLVDLRKNAETRMKEMDRTTRRRLRVASRELTIRRLTAEEWPIFKQCYEWGLDGNLATTRYYFSDNFYRGLIAADYATTWVAERFNAPLAVGCFLSSGVFAHTHLSGGNKNARKYHASYLIHAHAIEHYANLGCRWMHMGGGRTPDPTDPLLDFKSKFSSLRTPFYTAGIIYNRAVYGALGGNRNSMFQGYRFPELQKKQAASIKVHEAKPVDYPSYFALRCAPANIAWTGFAAPPDWQALKSWFELESLSQRRRILLAENADQIVGYAYAIDHGERIETTISTESQACMPQTVPTIIKAVTNLLSINNCRPVETWIFPENKSSVKAHEAAGYRRDHSRPPRIVTAELAEMAGEQACWVWRMHA